MGGSYQQVGSAADVNIQQLNPYSDVLTSLLMGQSSKGSAMDEWISRMPGLQGLVSGLTDPYARARMTQAGLDEQQIQQDIGSQFADIGALRSSAAMGAIGKGVAGVRAGALSDILGKQMGMLQSFGLGGLESIGTERSLLASLARPEYYVYEPTYQYKPGVADYLFGGIGAAGQAAGGVGSLISALKMAAPVAAL